MVAQFKFLLKRRYDLSNVSKEQPRPEAQKYSANADYYSSTYTVDMSTKA